MEKTLKRHSCEDGIHRRLIDGNYGRLPRYRIRKGEPLFPLARQCFWRLRDKISKVGARSKDISSEWLLVMAIAEPYLAQREGQMSATTLAVWRDIILRRQNSLVCYFRKRRYSREYFACGLKTKPRRVNLSWRLCRNLLLVEHKPKDQIS